jgi:DnaD/phage-associated family protein
MAFTGFTRETLYTPVPNSLLGEVLEQIQDLAELKVTLRGLWLLNRKQAPLRALSLDEFLGDRSLVNGLQQPDKDGAEEVRRGLRLAVGRGTFLTHKSETAGVLFLLNNDAGRRSLARLKESSAPPFPLPPDDAERGPAAPAAKPNIFALYEDNIGTLSPILADELKEAEERYPWSWINEAFQIAVLTNKRNWRYISGILRRWSSEGKDGRLSEGKEYGKPGRHPSKDQRQKHIEEYERQRRRAAKSAGRNS